MVARYAEGGRGIRPIDLTGMEFGKLTVLEQNGNYIFPSGRKGERTWLCRCCCGQFCIKRGSQLRDGKTKSCRCYAIQIIKETNSEKNTFEFNGEEVKGFDTKGNYFIIDIEDYEKVKLCYWRLDKNGYWVSKNNGKLHQYIYGEKEGMVINHIKQNPNDNRKSMLEFITQKDNTRKHSLNKNNKTGYSGIQLTQNKKYKVLFNTNKKRTQLGTFNTIEEAIKVRYEAEEKYWGFHTPELENYYNKDDKNNEIHDL